MFISSLFTTCKVEVKARSLYDTKKVYSTFWKFPHFVLQVILHFIVCIFIIFIKHLNIFKTVFNCLEFCLAGLIEN